MVTPHVHPSTLPGQTPARQQATLAAVLTTLLLLALLSAASHASGRASPLWIEAASTATEWGRPLTVRVYLSDPRRNLQDLDLSTWQQQLDIRRDEVQWRDPPDDFSGPADPLQMVRLRLHPLRPGPIALPPLQVSGAYSQPLKLEVKASHQGPDALLPSLTVSTPQPWERQQTVLTVSLDSPDAYAILHAESPLKLPGFEIHPIPLQREPQGNHTRLTLAWALFPLVPGAYRLRLPALEYRVNGRKVYSWHLPAAAITVQALPAYLPPTLPVGQLHIHGELQPQGILNPDKLAWWTITISGPLPAAWLPTPALQPAADSSTLLAAEQTLSTHTGRDGITATRQQQFPIKPGSSGRLQLPSVAISWFDPQSGQLQRRQISAPRRWVIARHWTLLAAILATLIALYALYRGISWARRRLRRCREHHQALAQLASADTPRQLRQALNQLGNAHGWSDNLCIRAWLSHWQQHYQTPAGLEDSLNRLSRQCYHRATDRTMPLDPKLKQQLLSLLRRPRRMPRRHQRAMQAANHARQ